MVVLRQCNTILKANYRTLLKWAKMTNILILFTIKHLISLKKSMHLKNLFIAYRRIAKYYAPAFFLSFQRYLLVRFSRKKLSNLTVTIEIKTNSKPIF